MKFSRALFLAAFSMATAAYVSAAPSHADKKHSQDHGHDHGHDGSQGAGSHDDDHKPKHGGQFTEDGHHGVEMVSEGSVLTFYISEHHEPLDLEGSQFKAVVQTDGGIEIVKLQNDGTKATGKLNKPLAPGAKVALSGKDGHGDTIQARFVVK